MNSDPQTCSIPQECQRSAQCRKRDEELKILKSKMSMLQSREELWAILSHELKSPLTALSMMSELIEREKGESEKNTMTQRLSHTIKTTVHQMLTLTSDLIDLNKLEQGHLRLELSKVSVENLIEAAFTTHTFSAEAKKIQLEACLSPRHLSVVCDPSRILQVLSNLLGNAIRFSPSGGKVSVEAFEQKKEVVIRVKDQGQGIDSHQIPHLFEKFWQAKHQNGLGFGLGLFITKKIIDAHGGRIWVESAPLQGSSFYASLPNLGVSESLQ